MEWGQGGRAEALKDECVELGKVGRYNELASAELWIGVDCAASLVEVVLGELSFYLIEMALAAVGLVPIAAEPLSVLAIL